MIIARPRLSKTSVVAAITIAVSAGLLWAQSAVSRLGLTDEAAHRMVLSTLVNGAGGPGAGSRSFLAMAPAMRAAAVTEVAGWAKAYIGSPAFKKEWADQRDHSKPQPPAAKGSADDQLKRQNADMQKQIDEMKKAIASLPPEQRKAMEPVVQQAIAQMQAAAGNPQQQALQKQGIEGQRANDQQRYQEDLKKWDRDFPADPAALIARRLHEFLDLSAGVNFDAKLVDRSGRKYFADPQYESKPESWKICFRAGREATGAARAAASSWLKDLGR